MEAWGEREREKKRDPLTTKLTFWQEARPISFNHLIFWCMDWLFRPMTNLTSRKISLALPLPSSSLECMSSVYMLLGNDDGISSLDSFDVVWREKNWLSPSFCCCASDVSWALARLRKPRFSLNILRPFAYLRVISFRVEKFESFALFPSSLESFALSQFLVVGSFSS